MVTAPQAGPGPTVEELRALRCFLLPLPPKAKEPPPKGWKEHVEPYEIPTEGNVAVAVGERSGGLAVLITNDDASTTWATEKFGPPTVRSRRGGHWWFKAPPGTANEANKETSVGLMELHATTGKYALVPPSIHPSGTPYTWGGGPVPPELPPLPDIRDLWHPGGTHHMELLTQSAAKAHDGKDAETIFTELRSWRDGHLLDPHAHPDTELRQMAGSAYIKFHDARLPDDGPGLFREAREKIAYYYRFPEAWCLDIITLWVMGTYVSSVLSAYFYLYLPATFGSGKTKIIRLAKRLAYKSYSVTDTSVASVARKIGELGAPVTLILDEFGAGKNEELDTALTVVVRDGYTADAGGYDRVDPRTMRSVHFDIHGFKLIAFRGAIDQALESRGVSLICASFRGKAGIEYIKRGRRIDVGDLPQRLEQWAEGARREKLAEEARGTYDGIEWDERLVRLLGAGAGANRETELADSMLMVLHLVDGAGVLCLEDSIRAALRLRAEGISVNSSDLEDLLAVIEDAARDGANTSLDGEGGVRLRQKTIKDTLNRRKTERKEKPLGDSQFLTLRRDLGVRDDMVSTHGHAKYWNLPKEFFGQNSPGMAPQTPLAPPTGIDVKGSQGSQGSLPQGYSEYDSGGKEDPEDLLGPGPTRSDRALANARREGSLAPDPPLKKEMEKRWPANLGCQW